MTEKWHNKNANSQISRLGPTGARLRRVWHRDCQWKAWSVGRTLMRRAVPLQACRIKCLSLKALWQPLGFPTAASGDWREIMKGSAHRDALCPQEILFILARFLREKEKAIFLLLGRLSTACQINFTLCWFLLLHRPFSYGYWYTHLPCSVAIEERVACCAVFVSLHGTERIFTLAFMLYSLL